MIVDLPGFYFDTSTMAEFNITVNKIATGLGATGHCLFWDLGRWDRNPNREFEGRRFGEFDASQESLVSG